MATTPTSNYSYFPAGSMFSTTTGDQPMGLALTSYTNPSSLSTPSLGSSFLGSINNGTYNLGDSLLNTPSNTSSFGLDLSNLGGSSTPWYKNNELLGSWVSIGGGLADMYSAYNQGQYNDEVIKTLQQDRAINAERYADSKTRRSNFDSLLA